MPWVVELGDDYDTQRFAISNNFLHHGNRINLILLKGTVESNIRVTFESPREAVIVNTVPVEDIKLSSKHAIKHLLKGVHTVESSCCVKHEASIRISGEVSNLNGVKSDCVNSVAALLSGFDELRKRAEASSNT